MFNRTCAVFIFDGFADHEVGLAMAWLNRECRIQTETFSHHGKTVVGISGMQIAPHASLEEMDASEFDLLLLPGGAGWETGDNLEIFPLIRAAAGIKPILAIGSATLALADLGLLDDIPHTSPYPGYLQQYCPEYKGSHLYQQTPYVTAGEIITANHLAMIPMAWEVQPAFGTEVHNFFEQ